MDKNVTIELMLEQPEAADQPAGSPTNPDDTDGFVVQPEVALDRTGLPRTLAPKLTVKVPLPGLRRTTGPRNPFDVRGFAQDGSDEETGEQDDPDVMGHAFWIFGAAAAIGIGAAVGYTAADRYYGGPTTYHKAGGFAKASGKVDD